MVEERVFQAQSLFPTDPKSGAWLNRKPDKRCLPSWSVVSVSLYPCFLKAVFETEKAKGKIIFHL